MLHIVLHKMLYLNWLLLANSNSEEHWIRCLHSAKPIHDLCHIIDWVLELEEYSSSYCIFLSFVLLELHLDFLSQCLYMLFLPEIISAVTEIKDVYVKLNNGYAFDISVPCKQWSNWKKRC
ncbi:hypothetical protein ACP70R_019169 [Stipagrostis hirtigluma subsp. patula]